MDEPLIVLDKPSSSSTLSPFAEVANAHGTEAGGVSRSTADLLSSLANDFGLRIVQPRQKQAHQQLNDLNKEDSPNSSFELQQQPSGPPILTPTVSSRARSVASKSTLSTIKKEDYANSPTGCGAEVTSPSGRPYLGDMDDGRRRGMAKGGLPAENPALVPYPEEDIIFQLVESVPPETPTSSAGQNKDLAGNNHFGQPLNSWPATPDRNSGAQRGPSEGEKIMAELTGFGGGLVTSMTTPTTSAGGGGAFPANQLLDQMMGHHQPQQLQQPLNVQQHQHHQSSAGGGRAPDVPGAGNSGGLPQGSSGPSKACQKYGMVSPGPGMNMPLDKTPYVKIIEQPAENKLRFRYECEGRSAGALHGVNYTPDRKTFPSIQVLGYHGPAVVVVSCVEDKVPYRTHPHNLVGKDGMCKKGVCSMEINNPDMTIHFQNLGIQCVRRKDAPASLSRREQIQVDPFKQGFKHKNSSINLNAIRLCFQVFLKTRDRGLVQLTPVVSNVIRDKKAYSDLQILEYSDDKSPVEGGKKIMLFCEKVYKEDIEVHFTSYTKGGEPIVCKGYFASNDVHKQYGIALRTPPYPNLSITEPVQVSMYLYKPSEKTSSEPVDFWYLPSSSPSQAVAGDENNFNNAMMRNRAMASPLHSTHNSPTKVVKQQQKRGRPPKGHQDDPSSGMINVPPKISTAQYRGGGGLVTVMGMEDGGGGGTSQQNSNRPHRKMNDRNDLGGDNNDLGVAVASSSATPTTPSGADNSQLMQHQQEWEAATAAVAASAAAGQYAATAAQFDFVNRAAAAAVAAAATAAALPQVLVDGSIHQQGGTERSFTSQQQPMFSPLEHPGAQQGLGQHHHHQDQQQQQQQQQLQGQQHQELLHYHDLRPQHMASMHQLHAGPQAPQHGGSHSGAGGSAAGQDDDLLLNTSEVIAAGLSLTNLDEEEDLHDLSSNLDENLKLGKNAAMAHNVQPALQPRRGNLLPLQPPQFESQVEAEGFATPSSSTNRYGMEASDRRRPSSQLHTPDVSVEAESNRRNNLNRL